MIEGMLALTALLAVLYRPWQRLCVDYARDIIFEQREAVFDLAANGRLEFGSELYETVRDEMNGMIRLAHKLTVWRLIFLRVLATEDGEDPAQTRIDVTLSKIPDLRTREDVMDRLHRARAAVAMVMFTRSLPFFLALVLTIAIWRLMVLIGRDQIELLRRMRNSAEHRITRTIEKAVREESWMAPV
jgi:hypothetical protein